MPLTVAILNDYPLIVAGLHELLGPYPERVLLIEARPDDPTAPTVDVVLYDTFGVPYGPQNDPRGALGVRDAKLVALTWDLEPEPVEAALRRGIDGFVSKASSAEELLAALEAAHRGEQVRPEGMSGTGDEEFLGRWPGEEQGLSARESQVIALVCEGVTNAEIAARIYVSINTVKTYIRSAYRKIGAATRPQAVIWGLSNGFDPVLRPQSEPRSSAE